VADELQVTGVHSVAEPEPGLVEITLELREQSKSILRMNLITFLSLWAGIKHLASPADPLAEMADDDDGEEVQS